MSVSNVGGTNGTIPPQPHEAQVATVKHDLVYEGFKPDTIATNNT